MQVMGKAVWGSESSASVRAIATCICVAQYCHPVVRSSALMTGDVPWTYVCPCQLLETLSRVLLATDERITPHPPSWQE